MKNKPQSFGFYFSKADVRSPIITKPYVWTPIITIFSKCTITTGLAYFAECQRHSAKAGKHSVKKSPSVALGEAHTAFLLPAKTAMPSAFSRALGKFLPCATPHSAKKNETGRPNGTNGTGRGGELCRVPDSWH